MQSCPITVLSDLLPETTLKHVHPAFPSMSHRCCLTFVSIARNIFFSTECLSPINLPALQVDHAYHTRKLDVYPHCAISKLQDEIHRQLKNDTSFNSRHVMYPCCVGRHSRIPHSISRVSFIDVWVLMLTIQSSKNRWWTSVAMNVVMLRPIALDLTTYSYFTVNSAQKVYIELYQLFLFISFSSSSIDPISSRAEFRATSAILLDLIYYYIHIPVYMFIYFSGLSTKLETNIPSPMASKNLYYHHDRYVSFYHFNRTLSSAWFNAQCQNLWKLPKH